MLTTGALGAALCVAKKLYFLVSYRRYQRFLVDLQIGLLVACSWTRGCKKA